MHIFISSLHVIYYIFKRNIYMLCIYLSTYFLSQERIKISSELQRKIFFKEIILLDKILVCPDVRKTQFEN